MLVFRRALGSHRSAPRTSALAAAISPKRHLAAEAPWGSKLQSPTDTRWQALGDAVVENAVLQDSGAEAFEECLAVRAQLEEVVHGAGLTDTKVCVFGGVVTNRLLQTGGDVDFVVVADSEPTFERASDAVSRLGRHMRRLGMRATSIPRARVPVVKVDRVSTALPGTPLHSMAPNCVFQLLSPATPALQAEFDSMLRDQYGVTSVEWAKGEQLATAAFPTTHAAVCAMSNVTSIGPIQIPLRLPLEAKLGPELYRFPFDLCLQSSGLQNSYLIAEALDRWDLARHLLLFVKRWGRSSGIVNSIDGLLSSYGLTVLVMHFLVRLGVVPPLNTSGVAERPQALPVAPTYRALAEVKGDTAELGYITAAFFEYFANIFDHDEDVAATTQKVLKKSSLRWSPTVTPAGDGATQRPPFFHLCIKDPYNRQNIGRNLSKTDARYVHEAFRLANSKIHTELDDPGFVVSLLSSSAPRPDAKDSQASLGLGGGDPGYDELQADARRMLKKLEFHNRKASIERIGVATARRNNQVREAQDLTRSIVSWIRGRPNDSPSAGF